jgi:predicted Zn finger-like uncharacterized protein
MIIPCKSCESAFRLDSKLLKPAGSKVRCSKCRSVFKIYPPKYPNRRKHKRLKTRNLISHVSYDTTGRMISQGLSKVLNISMGGMLLETPEPILSGLISLMATDVKNKLIEIDGNLVHCEKASSGRYHSGVSFLASEDEKKAFVTQLIKEYNFRKSSLLSDN